MKTRAQVSTISPAEKSFSYEVELFNRGVKLIFTEGHISIVVALKGPVVTVKTV